MFLTFPHTLGNNRTGPLFKTWQLKIVLWMSFSLKILLAFSICYCIISWLIHLNTEVLFFFKIFFFYWSIVDLQCCVNFCCTAKWISYIHRHILFNILTHYGLSQDIEFNSLCFTVGSCCLSQKSLFELMAWIDVISGEYFFPLWRKLAQHF